MPADSNETLRSLLSGFNSMQYNLGLLPSQGGTMPMGVPPTPGPGAPPVPHPSEYAMAQVAQLQAMSQQNLAMAQQTRFQPPPSSPFTWSGSMQTMNAGQFNPYVANALGGLGGAAGGMPDPSYMTAPQYGMYRPGGGGVPYGFQGGMSNRLPSPFNPMAPAVPSPHFATPAMQQLQIMQSNQARSAATVAGLWQGGWGLAGSIAGSALGSLAGPVGTIVGGYLGEKAGDFIGSIGVGPALTDLTRGRQMQNMTAPFMVSGSHLNPFTGQGMDRQSAVETSRGLRQMARTYDFQRTGFNTQDLMKLTDLAGEQGLLQAAQNPDDILRKMKDVSKAVKSLVQITGDPDVRNAIASLGQMKQLGFNGLAGQAGAVTNRALFARMAGVSQAAMDSQYGMPGAMMAQGLNLAGSTGYAAGMASAGMGNVAVSSGSFSDLQLARAGGKQGLAQINTMATLGAANQDLFMAASIARGKNGEMTVDMDRYKSLHGMDIGQVARLASQNIHDLGVGGNFVRSTRGQELKDKIAQSMTPMDLQLNALYQAKAMQKSMGPGATIGSAFMMMGLSETEARTMELQYENPEFYKGLRQQLNVQRRDVQDRARAAREQFRTPGALTRMGRGIHDALSATSDFFSDPVHGLMERAQRVDEDIMEQNRGGYMRRYNESQTIRSANDAALAARMLGSRDFASSSGVTSGDAMAEGAGSRLLNQLGYKFSMASSSAANQSVYAANSGQSSLFGMHTILGNTGVAQKRLQGFNGVATMSTAANSRDVQNGTTLGRLQSVLGDKASAAIGHAVNNLRNNSGKAGFFMSAQGMSADEVKDAAIKGLVASGMSQSEAETHYANNADALNAEIMAAVDRSGDNQLIERKNSAIDAALKGQGADAKTRREGIERRMGNAQAELGIGGIKGDTLETIKNLAKNTDSDTLAYAAAQANGNTKEMTRLEQKFKGSPDKLRAMQNQAASLFSAQSDDVKKALRDAGSLDNAGDRFDKFKDAVGLGMAGAAFQKSVDNIADATGNKDIKDAANVDDLIGKVSGISDEALGKVKGSAGKALAAYRRAMQSGDSQAADRARAALQAAVITDGPSATAETMGSNVGTTEDTSLDSRDQELASLQKEAADKLDRVADKLDKVADKMGGSADKSLLHGLNPSNWGSR